MITPSTAQPVSRGSRRRTLRVLASGAAAGMVLALGGCGSDESASKRFSPLSASGSSPTDPTTVTHTVEQITPDTTPFISRASGDGFGAAIATLTLQKATKEGFPFLQATTAAPIGATSVAVDTYVSDIDSNPLGWERIRVVTAQGREVHALTVWGCGLKALPGTGDVATLQIDQQPEALGTQPAYHVRALELDESLRTVGSIDLGTHPGTATCRSVGAGRLGHLSGENGPALDQDAWAIGEPSANGHWVAVMGNTTGSTVGYMANFARRAAVRVPGTPRYVLGNGFVQGCAGSLGTCVSTEDLPRGRVLDTPDAAPAGHRGVCVSGCSWFSTGDPAGTAVLEGPLPPSGKPGDEIQDGAWIIDPTTGTVLHDLGKLAGIPHYATYEPHSRTTVVATFDAVYAFDSAGHVVWQRPAGGRGQTAVCATVGSNVVVMDSTTLHLVSSQGRDAAHMPWNSGNRALLTCPAVFSTGFIVKGDDRNVTIYRL